MQKSSKTRFKESQRLRTSYNGTLEAQSSPETLEAAPEAPSEAQSSLNGLGQRISGMTIAESTEAHPYPDSHFKNRVRKDQVPSLVEYREGDQERFMNERFGTMEKLNPPLASTDYTAIDQGNASPKFVRLSLYNIPSTATILNASNLPFAAVCQPLAEQNDDEMSPPTVDFGDEGPPRCMSCSAFINPFVIFVEHGTRYICNLCRHVNIVQTEYYAPLGQDGRRIDWEQRPELQYGSVDYVVPQSFATGDNDSKLHLFLIDVSEESIKSALHKSAGKAIREALYGSDHSLTSETKVAFMTFDRTLHFYHLDPRLKEPRMLIVSDIEEPYAPLMDGLFVDAYQARSVRGWVSLFGC